MKRMTMTALMLALAISVILAGCGRSKEMNIVEGKINVVTTFYPIYDFARQIGGEHAHVMNLIPAGVEPHEWSPNSQELLVTSKAQLFMYNGAGFEGWVPTFLQGLDPNSNLKTVEVSSGIELLYTAEDDGHNHGHEHGPEGTGEAHEHEDEQHAHGEDGDHKDEGSGHDHEDLHVDPHTWVSPKSALKMADNIYRSYVEADPEHQADYEANYEALAQRLRQLDDEFGSSLASAARKEIVVSHQAFGYLCRDYGLTQKAIMGLSPEAEPRSQDLLNLIAFVKENDVRYIFFEELVSDQLARTLANETNVETLVLNPLEGLTKEQANAGEDYVSVMEQNLQNLMKALQ